MIVNLPPRLFYPSVTKVVCLYRDFRYWFSDSLSVVSISKFVHALRFETFRDIHAPLACEFLGFLIGYIERQKCEVQLILWSNDSLLYICINRYSMLFSTTKIQSSANIRAGISSKPLTKPSGRSGKIKRRLWHHSGWSWVPFKGRSTVSIQESYGWLL